MKKQITIYLARNGIEGLIKGMAVMREEGNKSWPIFYIKKAKGASEKEFKQIIDSLFP